MPASWLAKYGYSDNKPTPTPNIGTSTNQPSWLNKYQIPAPRSTQPSQPIKPSNEGYTTIGGKSYPTASIVKTPLKPTNVFESAKSVFENLGVAVGRKLQKTPNLDLGTKGQKTFKATDTETKIINFISNFPSAIAQSYGKSLETLSTKEGRKKLKEDAKNLPKTMSEVKTHIENREWQKAFDSALSNSALTVGLDVADFIPISLVAKMGFKGVTSGLKKTAQQVVKQTIKESEEKIIKPISNHAIITQEITQRNVKDLIIHEAAPDTGTIAKYKQEIQAGGRPPLLVIKEGEKFGIEDGKHKLEAYKQLGITEVPTIEKTVKPKAEIIEPIGEGEARISKLGLRVEQTAIEKKLVKELGDLPDFKQMNMKEQAKMASDLIKIDEDRAVRIALGQEAPPKGLLAQSVFKAMEGSITTPEMARKLATSPLVSEASALGQKIKALDVGISDSPVKAMQDVIEARKKTLEERYGTIGKATERITKDIQSKVKIPNKYDWNKFIEGIAC